MRYNQNMHKKILNALKSLINNPNNMPGDRFKFYNIILILFAIALGLGSVLARGNENQKILVYDQPKRTLNYIYPQKPEDTRPQLIIDKLDIAVPVILDVDGKNKTQYNKALYDGVAHMKKTAQPGEKGNTFIFGHSSYTDKSNKYAKIFATLNQLQKNDEIKIKWQDKNYLYIIKDKKVVAANYTEATAQNLKEHIITLMTCWPIGTKEKRLIVIAELTN